MSVASAVAGFTLDIPTLIVVAVVTLRLIALAWIVFEEDDSTRTTTNSSTTDASLPNVGV